MRRNWFEITIIFLLGISFYFLRETMLTNRRKGDEILDQAKMNERIITILEERTRNRWTENDHAAYSAEVEKRLKKLESKP